MTILAAFKEGDAISIVADFRVSFASNQVDAISKFFIVDDKMGFFTAGSVYLWRQAASIIQANTHGITFENVAVEDGPLHSSLRSLIERSPKTHGMFGGIGVYWDRANNQSLYFELVGQAGNGLRIRVIEDGVIVLGSGSQIPKVSELLEQEIQRHLERSGGFYPFDTAEVIRRQLKFILSRCGSSSYGKLGISPIFSLSAMNSDGFMMRGEEIKGEHYMSGATPIRYHFSFERKDGHLVLYDHLDNRTIKIHDVSDFPHNGQTGIEFDPEGLTTRFDAPSYLSGDTIYIMNQWVEDTFVDRTVWKTTPFTFMGRIMANPLYKKITSVHKNNLQSAVLSHFKNTGYHGLIVLPENQTFFEAGIKRNIMNHNWLARYVENYADFYTG